MDITPPVVSDPGKFPITEQTFSYVDWLAGMTDANMQLLIAKVVMEDKLETPEQKLDAGEYIVKRVVELSKLREELNGKVSALIYPLH